MRYPFRPFRSTMDRPAGMRREGAMNDCLFCAIARKELACDIVHEDDEFLVFKDIQPQAPIHLLIIPKKHIPGAAEIAAEDAPLVGRIVAFSKQLAERCAISRRGFRLDVNSGSDAGQAVDHLHVHFLGGRRLGWPPG